MRKMAKSVEKFWEFGLGRMALAAFCAHSVSISIGISQGYSAILIPQLQESGEFSVTTEESSWLASLGAVTNPIGSVLSGVLAEYFGRRRSIQISTIPFVLGWICIGVATNIEWLYAGRLITGIAAGMSTASYTYVSEISTPTSRGVLQSLGPVCASFGILLTYTLGYLVKWSTVAIISIIFGIISVITMQFLPESPPYLLKMKLEAHAYKAYMFFNNNVITAQNHLDKYNADNTDNDDKKTLRELYLSPETIKPFFILVVLFLLQETSGIYTVLFYAVSFFGEADVKLNDYISSIIVGCIRLIMSIIAALLVNKFGRKILCTLSSFGMAIAILIVALYVRYYESFPNQEKILHFLPLICIMLNVMFSMMGMLPIPWILVGEMFPLRVRPIMCGVVICIAQMFIFVSVKIYNDMILYLNFSGTLFVFFVAAVAAMLFCKFVLPETKNKSLDEIEEYFRGDSSEKGKNKKLQGFENRAFTISSENLSRDGSKKLEAGLDGLTIVASTNR